MHFQKKKLVIHVAKMQQILFFVHQRIMNVNCPIGNVFCGSVADTKVKRRAPKHLLECSMRKLQNELIASPDDVGLVGARHAITNGVIISDTMLHYLAPPQLLPKKNNHKVMCGCVICDATKYMQ